MIRSLERGSFTSSEFDQNILDIKTKGHIEKIIYSSVIDDKREQLSDVFKKLNNNF